MYEDIDMQLMDWVVGLLRNGYRNDGPVSMVSMHVDR